MTVIEPMVRIYANLVDKKIRTIDSLPEIYKQPVQAYLDSQGADGNDPR